MNYRSYQTYDKARLLEIFHSNCPKYFDERDEEDLIDFLENYTDENYLVVEKDGKVIGCGGHYTKEDRFGIAWVMFEKGSIGFCNFLNVTDGFFQKIKENIKLEGKELLIYINTTQLMESLFNRYGFETFETIKNGFGEGLDEYKMKLLADKLKRNE